MKLSYAFNKVFLNIFKKLYHKKFKNCFSRKQNFTKFQKRLFKYLLFYIFIENVIIVIYPFSEIYYGHFDSYVNKNMFWDYLRQFFLN